MTNSKIRPSPTNSATLYKTETKKKGNDGNMWIVVENKNNVKRWKLYKKTKTDSKIKTKMVKLTIYNAYEIPKLKLTTANFKKWLSVFNNKQIDNFNNFIKNIVPEIKKLGIKFYMVPLGISKTGYYFVDALYQILEDLYGYTFEEINSEPFIVLLLKINENNQFASNKFYINHGGIKSNIKKNFIKLMNKTFKSHYDWNGTEARNILISV